MADTPALATPVATARGDDPSALSTQFVLREIMHLRELTEKRIEGEIGTVETRLAGMDKALERAEEIAHKVPSDIDIAIKRLEQLTVEKIMALDKLIKTQLIERDQRSAEYKTAVASQVSAAFEAQKASVDKTERNFAELINQGRETTVQVKSSLEALINELKSRLDRGEGMKKGEGDQRGLYMGVAALIVSVIVALLAISNKFGGAIPP